MQIELVIELGDLVVFTIGLFYVLMVLTIGDLLRRKMNYSPDFTRKVIHLFAGGAIWTVPYYPHPWMATVLAATFVGFLLIAGSDRFSHYFEAMARPEDLEQGSVRGPFWYAVSLTILTGIFTFSGYERLYFIGAAAIHIMMFGDGFSAPIGILYGKNHTRTINGSKRSFHGSMALFVFGFIGAFAAFWYFGVVHYGAFLSGSTMLLPQMLVLALIGAVSATLIELVSPKGTDNTTVPLLTALIMFLVGMWMGVVII
ncbi:MAG: hypothetical protein K9W43_07120 [Candidatus Thorarchaeota archaeon]|nr:hypothetical protein [Candidatus Thorarchaeota archaeon]